MQYISGCKSIWFFMCLEGWDPLYWIPAEISSKTAVTGRALTAVPFVSKMCYLSTFLLCVSHTSAKFEIIIMVPKPGHRL